MFPNEDIKIISKKIFEPIAMLRYQVFFLLRISRYFVWFYSVVISQVANLASGVCWGLEHKQGRSDMTANYKPQQQIGDTTLIAKKQEQCLTMTKLRRQKIKRQNSLQ